MRKHGQEIRIDNWLSIVRQRFISEAPELLSLFETYSAEAVFGRDYIANDLQMLKPGARVLEVGAGALLLSCQLVREGFAVTALEPIGTGFSHFDRMRELVLDEARKAACEPRILNLPAERLSDINCFDYAFSINVMEHVDDVAVVLSNVGKSLIVGGRYRFTCPNYLFPYEPHFNIPTLLSKKLTKKVLGKLIFGSERVTDPLGTWKSLNWINVLQVGAYVRDAKGLTSVFSRSMLVATLERIVSDPGFASRRSSVVRCLCTWFVHLRMHYLLSLVPAFLQPIMDCTVQRHAVPEIS